MAIFPFNTIYDGPTAAVGASATHTLCCVVQSSVGEKCRMKHCWDLDHANGTGVVIFKQSSAVVILLDC